MKNKVKIIAIILMVMMLFTACSSSGNTNDTNSDSGSVIDNTSENEDNVDNADSAEGSNASGIDYDLTTLSSTMVFSQVYDIVYYPNNYIDKTFKIQGIFESYNNPEIGADMHFVVIMDAAGCCPQGLEVRFEDGVTLPDQSDIITIEGTFLSQEVGDGTYYYIQVSSLDM